MEIGKKSSIPEDAKLICAIAIDKWHWATYYVLLFQ